MPLVFERRKPDDGNAITSILANCAESGLLGKGEDFMPSCSTFCIYIMLLLVCMQNAAA